MLLLCFCVCFVSGIVLCVSCFGFGFGCVLVWAVLCYCCWVVIVSVRCFGICCCDCVVVGVVFVCSCC